ncbi:hypothetical protein CP533_4933 [Ophiocordyceps camponoti-saundersi (nom. inval.)]|nr:hypothetical protein CP533_4933 [Ophiocordyceps camponoti-saundersi (nom. inval.)]
MKSLLRTAALRARASVAPARGRIVTTRGFASSGGEPIKTALYDFHVSRGGTMVEFAGHCLPAVYKDFTLSQSHRFTRVQTSLFDVSHMVQHIFSGSQAATFLEHVTPSSWRSTPMMQGKLTTLLWPSGGIVDDAVVTRLTGDKFYAVTNGACREKDIDYFKSQLETFPGRNSVDWRVLDGKALVALQGPGAAMVLGDALYPGDDGKAPIDLEKLYFGGAAWARLKLVDGSASPQEILISRGGYTGEDGFELSFGAGSQDGESEPGGSFNVATSVVEGMLQQAGPKRLRPAGLGARDSLRLEAGMCLYGQDLDDTTTPAEAGLGWVVSPDRRTGGGGFLGADIVIPQLKPRSKGGLGVSRKRVGLIVGQGPPARAGAELWHQGRKVGTVTSGMPSPTLGRNIAMGYVEDGLHKADTQLEALVRGKMLSAVVTKMPFVPTRYYKPPPEEKKER